MRIKVIFQDKTTKKTLELGPYDWVLATENELRVPVNAEFMDDEALDFKEFSDSTLQQFEGILAVRQNGGTWELREMAGREAYEVYTTFEAIRTE
ncbi:MAG: hypothetical protein ACE145_20150 [Terriglobia bacterium]